jgi:hypothetical protein
MKTVSIRLFVATAIASVASVAAAADQPRITMVGTLERSAGTGLLSVGGQAVTLSDAIPSGSFVRVSGVVSPNGTLFGDKVVVLAKSALTSGGAMPDAAKPIAELSRTVTASGAQIAGVTGTNIEGVTGTNIEGVTGTNIEGVTGTNIEGVTGTNIEGVTGTNIEGVTGTNIEGVTGTNIEGVTGTNIEGVTGTNIAGVTGTNIAGVTGTNAD